MEILTAALCADCLQYTLSDEELTGSSQYFCDSCDGKQDARKYLRLTQTPRVLVLHIVRIAAPLPRRRQPALLPSPLICTRRVAPFRRR